MIEIVELTESIETKWDEFVLAHLDGKIVFLNGFRKTLQKTYGYKTLYIMFNDGDDQILGILPSLVSTKINLKKKLISMPFSANGGFLFRSGLSDKQLGEIEELLLDYCIKCSIDSIEIRGGQPWISGNASVESGYDYGLLLIEKPEKLWQNLHRSVRKSIKKAKRFKLDCKENCSEAVIKEIFYPLYLKSMKRFGTPPQPLSFFLNQYRYLKEFLKMFIVTYEGKPISILTGFVVDRSIELAFIVSDENYWDYRPNDLAHWSLIKWGYENSYKEVFFGPMNYPGQRQYKEKWSVTEKKYYYYKLYPKYNLFNVLYFPRTTSESFPVRILSKFIKKLPYVISLRFGPTIRKVIKR